MRGQVLESATGKKHGLILGDDGKRYPFERGEWKAVVEPNSGAPVDYLVAGEVARDVFPLSAIGVSAQTFVPVYPNNSSVLGGFGIACLCLGFFFPVLLPLIGLVLGFMGAGSAKRFGDTGGLALSRIAWIGNLLLLSVQLIGVLLLFTIFSGFALIVLHDLAAHGTIHA